MKYFQISDNKVSAHFHSFTWIDVYICFFRLDFFSRFFILLGALIYLHIKGNEEKRMSRMSKNRPALSNSKWWGSSFSYNLWYLFWEAKHFYAILQYKRSEAFVTFIVPLIIIISCRIETVRCCPYPSHSPFFCFEVQAHWINENKFKSDKKKPSLLPRRSILEIGIYFCILLRRNVFDQSQKI